MSKIAEQLRDLPSIVLPEEERDSAADMIPDDLERRLRAANQRSSAEWQAIKTRDDWQRFRDQKLRLLREAMGPLREEPGDLRPQVTGTIDGDGYRVKKLVFQSRPGLWVTANLCIPAEPADSMPGLLICHSHHRPKEHGELQDMGMTWARHGCLVLAPDMLGHGERRQHPFVTEADYHASYRVSRQDYYFRYDTGMQLALAGESLMGWFVHDLRCCVTVLLSQPGVDPKRVILLGAVADAQPVPLGWRWLLAVGNRGRHRAAAVHLCPRIRVGSTSRSGLETIAENLESVRRGGQAGRHSRSRIGQRQTAGVDALHAYRSGASPVDPSDLPALVRHFRKAKRRAFGTVGSRKAAVPDA